MTPHKNTPTLKAVIFDWAGTTIDYGCFAPVAVFIEVFARRHVTVTIPQARLPMGLQKKDHIRAIAAQTEIAAAWLSAQGRLCSEADLEAMYQDSVDIQMESVSQHAALIPGALKTIAHCRARGLKIGSSTGYSRAVMDIVLPLAARQGYLPDAILCPDDAPAGRPAPWMMYHNAMQLGVYPMSSVVKVGDTVPDIEEGLNAGAWTVAVIQTGNELGLSQQDAESLDKDALIKRLAPIEAHMRQAGAHYVVNSVADLPTILDDIEGRLRRREVPSREAAL